jgi:2-polyprenyl-6-methoxyphenol hydroxylase-like FAD-dependent oxidoreductase
MAEDRRVLIVGGGVAGLALGRALARAGIAAEVVERAARWSPAGAGIYIPANGMRALGQLGLAEPLISQGRVNTRRRYLTADGTTSFEIDLVDFWDGTGPCLGVTRAALHDVLLAGANGVPIRLGTTVDTLKEDADGVNVVFSDASTERYDLVVGADGIHSWTRDLLGGQDAVVRADLAGASWRFVVTCPDSVDCWTFLAGPAAMMLLVPIGQGRAYCFAALASRRRSSHPPEFAQLRDVFRQFADPIPEVTGQLDAVDRPYFSPLEELRAPVWGGGRTVLIGDAAHGMSPAMAQGAALAVEDALVLAGLLRAEPDWTAVAARLAAARDRRITWVMRHTSRQARLLTLPYPLRRRVLRLVGEKLWRRSFAPLREPI